MTTGQIPGGDPDQHQDDEGRDGHRLQGSHGGSEKFLRGPERARQTGEEDSRCGSGKEAADDPAEGKGGSAPEGGRTGSLSFSGDQLQKPDEHGNGGNQKMSCPI